MAIDYLVYRSMATELGYVSQCLSCGGDFVPCISNYMERERAVRFCVLYFQLYNMIFLEICSVRTSRLFTPLAYTNTWYG
jgi:hypothetical protein